MEIYLVGGAVRDQLLKLETKDRDWVVVGATADELLELNYKQVGKDFPVFLHPQSNEEYALARTERKTAAGYTGFSFETSNTITLEDDLARRDLTINAIAQKSDGSLVDPFNGQADIDAKILRHVSPAFAEDPLRILRIARFAARFANLGFSIADETQQLMLKMVNNGEVNALVTERVWQETQRALSEKTPARYFEVLRQCGALKILFPEIDRLWGVPQPEKHHPEIDTGVHTMMVLTQASKLSNDTKVRFAALVHDLGKGTTPKDQWPKHIEHESRGVPIVEALCDRYRIPNDYRELAVIVTKYHLHYHRAAELRDDTFLKTLESLDAFRRPERFELFLLACEADSRGRPGFEDNQFEQPTIYRKAFNAAQKLNAKELVQQGLKGPEIKAALFKQRVTAINLARKL